MRAVVVSLGSGDEIRAEAGAMTFMTDGIQMDARMTEGFILERFEGGGEVFAHSGGTIVPFELKAGEKLKVDTGCLVAFDPTVDYDIQFVGGAIGDLISGDE